MGATTIWERWDSLRPDGSVNPGGMTSFNHYALGAVADWLHRRVAGLAPAAAGYRTLTIDPLPTEQLTRASARHLTPYGEASVRWERGDGRLRLDVRVPVGVAADVHLPGIAGTVPVGHGDHRWEVADPVSEREAAAATGPGCNGPRPARRPVHVGRGGPRGRLTPASLRTASRRSPACSPATWTILRLGGPGTRAGGPDSGCDGTAWPARRPPRSIGNRSFSVPVSIRLTSVLLHAGTTPPFRGQRRPHEHHQPSRHSARTGIRRSCGCHGRSSRVGLIRSPRSKIWTGSASSCGRNDRRVPGPP